MARPGIFAFHLLVLPLLAACALLPGAPGRPQGQEAAETQRRVPEEVSEFGEEDTLFIPISLYMLRDEGGVHASLRQREELIAILDRANKIWEPAGIVFVIQTVEGISLPDRTVQAVLGGDLAAFFHAMHNGAPLPHPALLIGVYARSIGGPNGVNPFGTQLFFVADEPSVDDERVTAHEIGHILGLHHTLESRERLMFPGENGTELTAEEITVARYVARGLLSESR